MDQVLRWYFVAVYAIGFVVIEIRYFSGLGRGDEVERRAEGARRRLPALVIPLSWILPPTVILFRFAELELADLGVTLRLLGLALSFYAIAMLLAGSAVLGRFLVPRAVIFRSHELVIRGPYRLVRHPVYSGVLALWLAAGLANHNLALLVLWPLGVMLFWMQGISEERLLHAKFGASYERYAAATPRFLPRLRRAGAGGRVD